MGEGMNIIELAKQAGIEDAHFHAPHPGVIAQLERFAALVEAAARADEREACAKLAENRMLANENKNKRIGHHHACNLIAIDIRARGTT
jgi:hypothetical protein